MAASSQTIRDIRRVLTEELGDEQAARIVARLCAEVKGNASFTQTMQRLKDLFTAGGKRPAKE